MLAPDDIDPILGVIKRFYFDVCTADKTAYTTKTIQIYQTKDLGWLENVKEIFQKNSTLSNIWYNERISLVSGVTNGFMDYAAAFSSFRGMLENTEDKDRACSLLRVLLRKVRDNISTLEELNRNFNRYLSDYRSVSQKINDSIEEGWKNISCSENEILSLAEKIYAVQTQITELEGAVSLNSLNSMTVTDCKDIYTRLGSICYAMLVDGLSTPWLSVGILAYSFGKSVYDMVDNARKYEKSVRELQSYSKNFSYEQKKLAQIKVVLRMLYDYRSDIDRQDNSVNELIAFWRNEQRNIETIMNGISICDSYTSRHPEVMQLPIADTVWKMLGQAAQNIPVWLNQQADLSGLRSETITITI